jgi:hypothetical protein
MIRRAHSAVFAALVLAAGCGKKGPPLAPLHLVPGPATDVSVRRLGPDVHIQFIIPATNLNGPGRAEIDRVEIYAVTVAPGSPAPPNRDLLTAKYRVGSVPVKPPPVEGETPPDNAPPDTRPSPGEPAMFVEPLTPEKLTPVTFAAPPAPAGAATVQTPGAAPGRPAGTTTSPQSGSPNPAPATTPASPTAGTAPAASPPSTAPPAPAGTPPSAGGGAATPPVTGAAPGTSPSVVVPPAPPAPGATATAGTTPPGLPGSGATSPSTAGSSAATVAGAPQSAAIPVPKYPVRIYVTRGMTKRGRAGQASGRVQLPIVPPPPAPAALTHTWTAPAVPAPDVAPPGTAAVAPSPAGAAPGTAAVAPSTPAVAPSTAAAAQGTAAVAPSPAAGTAATPIPAVATAPAAAAPAGQVAGAPVPAAPPAVPVLGYNVYRPDATTPLNGEPLATTEYERTPIVFGTEQCFAVRTVAKVAGMSIESEPSAPLCVTPHDTFAPAQPKGLAVVAGTGTINLSWDANTEADLAGYLVLRGETTAATLQPLMAAPITGISFEDKTVRPGVRYAYAIVAVDSSVPPNRSAPSARVEETAR